MLIKFLANYGIAALAIATLFYIFFFHVMPALVRNYRNYVSRQRQYDRQFDNINKKD